MSYWAGLNTEETTKHVQDWMPINMYEIPLQSVPPTNTPMLTGTMVPDLNTGIVSGGRASYDQTEISACSTSCQLP